jgi:hypothetical protein
MPGSLRAWLVLAAAFSPSWSSAAEVTAGAPTDRAVSIYRAPTGTSAALDIDALGGFALISETRSVVLPAGESRIRFEGVADGIESESAIVSGLPGAVVEKNRDAHVLSPSALIAAAVGRSVELVRTDPKTGRTMRGAATMLSDADEGVVFQTPDGIEALRCSGLPETFLFDAATDLRSAPTLSVVVHSSAPTSAEVTLSYLAHGFDWMASYVVTLASDAGTMDIGAWVTLANGNGVSFPSAHTQIIAGRLNRATGQVEPYALERGVLARCWPRGSTSDSSLVPIEVRAGRRVINVVEPAAMMEAAAPPMFARAAAQLVEEEQLGDLKLYRVPERTNVMSRQVKQVRLLDRHAVPVRLIYTRELMANEAFDFAPAARIVRSKNDGAHHLGLPLPSGRVASFAPRGATAVLLAESPLRDVAVDEEFELHLGESADVQVRAVHERDAVNRVEIRNATSAAIAFELSIRLPEGMQLIGADQPRAERNGQPLFEVTIPAGSSTALRYQTERAKFRRQGR